MQTKKLADFLFEAQTLTELLRSGYCFLGSGSESVAEHSFMTIIIAFTLSKMVRDADTAKMMSMALFHDLPEARMGDLNYVQKKYVNAMEAKAVAAMCHELPFGSEISSLMDEFNKKETLESKLVNDADQVSFIMELKKLHDTGAKGPDKWISIVMGRLLTKEAKKLAQSILSTTWDNWWLKGYSE